MSFNIPTPATIQKRLEAEAADALNNQNAALPGTVENMIVRVTSVAAYEMYLYISYLAMQILPSTAAEEFLSRHASFWLGDVHKQAVAATGSVDIIGTAGTVIPAGTLMSRSDGIVFAMIEDATIEAGGVVQADIQALETGLKTNTDSGIVLNLSAPIIGVQSITVSLDGLGGGADVETDNALYGRVEERVQTPPQGGSESDYERWAKEVSGVTRAWARGNHTGIGTVGVTFVLDDKSNIAPTAGEVQIVQDHIDTVRPITADVSVFAPNTQTVDLEIALNPNTVVVQNAVRAELEDLFKREANANGVTLYLSRISEAISLGAGENNHALTSPNENTSFPFGTIPVLGAITWSAA